MTLEQLRVLESIVQSGGFRGASEQLHKAQSAISYAIKSLEEEMGVLIFNREKYRPVLTPEGEAIYKKAKQILRQTEELECLGKELSMGTEAEVCLAINAIVPLHPIKEVLTRFSKEFPHTRLKLYIENLGGAIERLADQEADIALAEIIHNKTLFNTSTCTLVQFLPVAAPSHTLAKKNKILSPRDMIEQTQITVRDTSRHSEKTTIGVLEESLIWSVSDFATKRELLLSGLGWGMMPKHLIEGDLKRGALNTLQLKEPMRDEMEIFISRLKNHPQGPAAAKLWEFIEQQFQKGSRSV